MIGRFVHEICGLGSDWAPAAIAQSAIEEIRRTAKQGNVLLALSGGVDSSVLSVLLQKAVGEAPALRFGGPWPAAAERGRAGGGHARPAGRAGHGCGCARAHVRGARGSERSRGQAQGHRALFYRSLRRRRRTEFRASSGWRREPSTRTSSNPPPRIPARPT